MGRARILLWTLVAGAAGAAAFLWWKAQMPPDHRHAHRHNAQSAPAIAPGARLGKPFRLTDHKGNTITETAFAGAPFALFFGFTHCPDICPTMLFNLTGWLEEISETGARVNAFFVTVDPERDDVAAMRDYLAAFDGRITGITGDPGGIAALAASWRVFVEKVEIGDGDYTVNHTASVFLVDEQGGLSGTIGVGESSAMAMQKLRRLASGHLGSG